MALDLGFDDGQAAIAAVVEQLCRDRCNDEVVRRAAGAFPEELWRELADLGVLSLASSGGEGGALELVAALEPLGRAAFPGPLVATILAAQLLPEKERVAVISGEAIASVGTPPLLPWAPLARVFVEIDGTHAWLGHPAGTVEPVDTLGGEPWGRGALERDVDLGEATRALALYDIALAAYLAAAGARLVADACEHARTRRQFGKTIAEFQAVSHPLAECHLRLSAAETLARAAAGAFDADAPDLVGRAACARLSASGAALRAAFTAHQVFGALGIMLEGPVFHVSRRVQQLAAQPPTGARCHEQAAALFGL